MESNHARALDSGSIDVPKRPDKLKSGVEERPRGTFREAILRVMADEGVGPGLTIWEIENRVSGIAVSAEYGLTELDTLSLLHEGLLDTTSDIRRYRLTELGQRFMELLRGK